MRLNGLHLNLAIQLDFLLDKGKINNDFVVRRPRLAAPAEAAKPPKRTKTTPRKRHKEKSKDNIFTFSWIRIQGGMKRLGAKVSQAESLYRRHGAKVSAVAKLIGLKGVDAATSKIAGGFKGAGAVNKAVREGDAVAGMEALRGAAASAGASSKMQAQAPNAIEKARKAQKVANLIRR